MPVVVRLRRMLTGERLYPPYKIAALVQLLSEDGTPAQATLRGTGLDPADLHDVACRTAVEQFLVACKNAMRLSRDRSTPFRLGARLPLSDFGIYGLLLLSAGSVRDYFRLAVKYQRLATPTLAIDAAESERHALWIFPDEASRGSPEDLRMFLIEQQVTQQVTHLRDVLGTDCDPIAACFTHPVPAHRELYGEYLRCPCVFNWHRSEIRYPKEVLGQRPRLANPLTAAMLQATCESLVADAEASLGFAGKVGRALRDMRNPGARMRAVASALKMTDRTLRRRLADEGTTFSTISHDIKYRVATQHLRSSEVSIEQIAAIAGFSDSANFRRAFFRWTSMSPAQFRRRRAEETVNLRASRRSEREGN
jgi:AraC-like DNA-binding protein